MNPQRLAKIRELEVLARDGYILIRVHRTAKVHASAVVGAEGQGYEWNGLAWEKMPQLGGVVIEEDVEVGAHCTIMRGALSDTIVRAGTKIGNGVNVGHGAEIGEHCLITAHVTIGGSAVLGSEVTVWMGAIVANKVRIGDNAVIGAGSVVLHDVPAGETWVGNPARRLVHDRQEHSDPGTGPSR